MVEPLFVSEPEDQEIRNLELLYLIDYEDYQVSMQRGKVTVMLVDGLL